MLNLCGTALLCCGCGDADPFGVGAMVPVSGQVLVNGKPLHLPGNAFARLWFYPDAAKGNPCPQIAIGDVDADGYYTLSVRGQEGAPLGWYKVLVIATEHVDPDHPSKLRRLFVPKKYGDTATSGLCVQVVRVPQEGAYDLKLQP
jgi:hypothetical protein